MIGIAILLTSFLAIASGTAAITMLTKSPSIGLMVGPVWGTFIFSIDRLLVASMTSKSNPWIGLLPRIAMATVLAYLVSAPLVTLVFQDKISEEMDRRQDAAIAAAEKGVADDDIGDVATRSEAFESARNQYQSCIEKAGGLYDDYATECDGTGGSQRRGCGTIAQAKLGRYEAKKTECEQIRSKLDKEDDAFGKAYETQRDEYERRKAKVAASFEGAGFSLKHDILVDLAFSDMGVLLPYLALSVLLWLVEVTPVLAKFSMLRYGQLIGYENALIEMRAERKLALAAWTEQKTKEWNSFMAAVSGIGSEYESAVQGAVTNPTTKAAIEAGAVAVTHDAVSQLGAALRRLFRMPPTPLVHSGAVPPQTAHTWPITRWLVRGLVVGVVAFAASATMALGADQTASHHWDDLAKVTGTILAIFQLIFLLLDRRRV